MKKGKRNAKRILRHKFEDYLLIFVMLTIAFPVVIYAKGIQKDTAEEININEVYGITTEDQAAEEARTYEPTTEEETIVFITPVEDLGEPTTAEYEEPTTSDATLSDSTEGTAVKAITDDFTLLCQMVRIELGEGSGEEYYNACYLQTATALNRLSQGWADTLREVLLMDGQYYGYGYHTWDWEQINIDIPDLQQAVLDCLEYNDTPTNLVFADSYHDHEGTDTKEFYAEICGQDFYLAK